MSKIKWLAVFMAGAILCGCGNSSAKEIDTNDLLRALLNEVTYDEILSETDSSTISNYIKLEDGVEAVMYMGSGSTAESVAIFTAEDAEAALKQSENVEDFLADQKSAFKDYLPEEAQRIDDAVVKSEGVYVVLCVSGDSEKAEEIIDQAFGK